MVNRITQNIILTKLFGGESGIGFLAATGLFLGFTHLWPMGTFILVGHLLHHGRFYFHPIISVLSAIILLSSIWSADPMAGVFFAINAHVLYAVWKSPVDKRIMFIWLSGYVSILAILAFLEIIWFHDLRPETFLVKDASLLGLIGTVTFHPLLTGFAGSRTAVLGIWLFAITTNRKIYYAVAMIATITLFTPFLYDIPGASLSRFTAQGIEHADTLRDQLSKPPENFRIPWYGLGFHSWVLETGTQRPHNIFLLAWYELGFFIIPFATVLIVGMFRVPFRVLIIVPLGFLVEEFYSRPEGLFMLFSMVLLAHYFTPNPVFFGQNLLEWKVRWRERFLPSS